MQRELLCGLALLLPASCASNPGMPQDLPPRTSVTEAARVHVELGAALPATGANSAKLPGEAHNGRCSSIRTTPTHTVVALLYERIGDPKAQKHYRAWNFSQGGAATATTGQILCSAGRLDGPILISARRGRPLLRVRGQ